MATPNAKTANETVTEPVTKPATETQTENQNQTEIPALAQKSREQLVSNLQQGQQLSVDAAQSWVKAVSALPVIDLPKFDLPKFDLPKFDLPKIPGIPAIPALPGVEAAAKFTFDVAADLLNAQRDFALQLTKVLVPAKAA